MVSRGLARLESWGNRLPDPVTLFVLAIVGVMVVSAWLSGTAVKHPGDGSWVAIRSVFDDDVLRTFLTDLPKWFAAFPPLGLVLLMMLGVGVAERSGLLAAVLGRLLHRLAPVALTPMVVLVGVLSSIAVDAGYVVVIPLAAWLFHQAGRPALAGLAAAFAGVSGGFSAHLLVTPLDALLTGLTQAAAQLVDPTYELPITANHALMAALVPVYVLLGTWVTHRWVEPALKQRALSVAASNMPEARVESGTHPRALQAVAVTTLLWILWVSWSCRPEGLFRDAAGSLAPLLSSLVVLLFLFFLSLGLVFGLVAGTIRSDRDAVHMMNLSLSDLGSYIVLVFFAAILLALFAQTQLGLLLAVRGAQLLSAWDLPGPLLLISVVFLTAFINLFMGSASAKWALLAPVLVPMLMVLSIDPAQTQAAFRLGDAATNPITPMLPYFPLILIMMQRYEPKAGIGTLLALMLPYALAFTVGGVALFCLWLGMGWPLDPWTGR